MKTVGLFLLSLLLGSGFGVGLAAWTIGPTVALASADQADTPAPVAVVDEQQHDFGSMLQGDTESHEFVVTNTGDAPLLLAVGETSCKCTLGEVSGAPIRPGGSAPVKLEWVAKSLPGPFRQVASLQTNDPKRPLIELSIDGEVVAARGISPGLLDLGVLDADAGGEAAVYVVAFERSDLEVSAAMADATEAAGRFAVAVEEVDPATAPLAGGRAAVKIVVQTDAALPIGPINEWVAVETNLNGGESFQLPIMGRVRGPVTLRGGRWNADAGVLNLGVVDGRQGAETRLLLYCRGPHAGEAEFEVGSVDPPELSVELGDRRTVREGVTLTPLRVAVPPGTRPMVRMDKAVGGDSGGGASGDGDGLLQIKSNHPASPEIRIPVRFVVQG